MKGTAEGVGRSFFFFLLFFSSRNRCCTRRERERERDRQRAHISLPARHSRKARPAEPSLIVVINFFLLLLLLLSFFVLGLVTERAQPDSRVRAESGFQPRDGPVELVDALRVDAEGGEAGVPALAASERVAGLDGVPVVEGFEVFFQFFFVSVVVVVVRKKKKKNLESALFFVRRTMATSQKIKKPALSDSVFPRRSTYARVEPLWRGGREQ